MKVLWIVNSPISHYLNAHGTDGMGATWIESIFDLVVHIEEIQMSICFPVSQNEEIKQERIDGVDYYTYKAYAKHSRSKRKIIETYKRIYHQGKPDIIHVWGTEFPWILDAVSVAEEMGMADKIVVSLQGMCTAIAHHYYAGLPQRIIYGFSLRDFLKYDNIWRRRKHFEKRGRYERNILKKIKYVIGRTDYDYAYSTVFNNDLQYFKCNETLREIFHQHTWKYENCHKHRIFLSQGYYPLKGVHFVIKAFALISDRYPDAEVLIAGSDILRENSKTGYLRGSGYAHYLRHLIKKYKLQGRVKFIGGQNTEEMCARYLESNVFISASSTENESNSLGEAKMLGMPVIASFVGGVGNRIKHREDGLAYQYDDFVMLARFICDIFDDPDMATQYGKVARRNELEISDRERNIERLVEIYREISGNERDIVHEDDGFIGQKDEWNI